MAASSFVGVNPAAFCHDCISALDQFPDELVREKYRSKVAATTPPSPGVSNLGREGTNSGAPIAANLPDAPSKKRSVAGLLDHDDPPRPRAPVELPRPFRLECEGNHFVAGRTPGFVKDVPTPKYNSARRWTGTLDSDTALPICLDALNEPSAIGLSSKPSAISLESGRSWRAFRNANRRGREMDQVRPSSRAFMRNLLAIAVWTTTWDQCRISTVPPAAF